MADLMDPATFTVLVYALIMVGCILFYAMM
jgi:hypothetical protein